MTAHDANLGRLHELLADRATQSLTDPEQGELTALLDAHACDDTEYDWAAAAVDLPVLLVDDEPMPPRLRARIEGDAVEWLARSKGMVLAGAQAAPSARADTQPRAGATTSGFSWFPWLATAACLALAIAAWWPSPDPNFAAERLALAAAPGTSVFPWNDMAKAGVTGDVMWNNQTQRGYLRFQGLSRNDPAKTQYQLWIFDKTRESYSANTAVDGGVFDVASENGEVIVPIDAKLAVFDPKLFAITTEPPGGVVVHEEDPAKGFTIILTAG